MKKIPLLLLTSIVSFILQAQPEPNPFFDYSNPKTYELEDIRVEGTRFLDLEILKQLTGLEIGQKVTLPGTEVGFAVQNLWKQKLFSDIQVKANAIGNGRVILTFLLTEKPRLTKYSIRGLRKGEKKTINEELHLVAGDVVTDAMKNGVVQDVLTYYKQKGFINASCDVQEYPDTTKVNGAYLIITINKGQKIKIREVFFEGNKALSNAQLRRTMKKTKGLRKKWNIFVSSKFKKAEYEDDKINIINKYNRKGYRDAYISWDSVKKVSDNRLEIKLHIEEGNRYYFRNITWVGNTKFRTTFLDTVLNIKKGDVYNAELLQEKLYMSQNSLDISSLYMDDGYIFFQINPVEVMVENDSIDIEIRIYEGKQATVNKVTIRGNTKTSDHVVLREIRTRPGQKFSRGDIIRTQRELAQLGYFDPEQLGVNPVPNPSDGTVDIEYKVEERPNDQIELSGGWGVNSIVGTLGLSLNNFSARKMFKPKEWRPIPTGDGQKLSIRAVSSGRAFQSYNFSFTEPWLGGKKPNSFTVSLYHSVFSNGYKKNEPQWGALYTTGATLALGKRLKWPDDFFTVQYSINYQYYVLKNYPSGVFSFNDGYSNNIFFRYVLSRNSIDNPIYPRSGSNISFSMQFTPPYSLFNNKDYATLSDQQKFKFIEYHKWKFDAQWFTKIKGKLVLHTRANFGIMGLYNRETGYSPFERFYVGGSGLTGFNIDGRELISLRGFPDNELTIRPESSPGIYSTNSTGATIYNRYTMELRYPFSLNPSFTAFGMLWLEGGNTWSQPKDFNPFQIYKAGGAGVRLFLPMFGIFGLDYGYRFNQPAWINPNANRWQFTFTIGQTF